MESEHKNYSREGMKEVDPGNINPDEVNKRPPSNAISERNRLDIEQSELGRDQGQTPVEEHIDTSFSQIDEQSAQQYESGNQPQDKSGTEDAFRADDRDTLDSSEDWDAEKNRTGRNK